MEHRKYCVYNQTRECFLSFGVTAAERQFAYLKRLIGRLSMRSDEGRWFTPSDEIHAASVATPVDLIYLDGKHRVIHLVEHLPTLPVPVLQEQSESVLQLPAHTIYSSQTRIGDQLLICVAEEMDECLPARINDPLEREDRRSEDDPTYAGRS